MTYTYNCADGRKQLSLEEVVRRVAERPDAPHHVWQAGWSAWKPWKQVEEIAAAVAAQLPTQKSPAKKSPAVAPVKPESYHYRTPQTEPERLDAVAVISRVLDAPDAHHALWRKGWKGWKVWSDIPAIAEAVERERPPSSPQEAAAGVREDLKAFDTAAREFRWGDAAELLRDMHRLVLACGPHADALLPQVEHRLGRLEKVLHAKEAFWERADRAHTAADTGELARALQLYASLKRGVWIRPALGDALDPALRRAQESLGQGARST